MVGIPGTEERLALAEIEDRLRRVRARFNLYTFQHHLYRFGTALALGAILLILGAFLLPPWLFTLTAWPLFGLLAFLCVFFVRREAADWANVTTAARRIDALASLKERLSTLVAQLTSGVIGKEPPSMLWPHLLADNVGRLDAWAVKKVAPSRIPWSIFPFLLALALALFVASVPMLSAVSQPNPFSPENVQSLLSQLPDRLGQLAEQRMSLLPDAPENWGGSSLFGDDKAPHPQDPGKERQAEQPTNAGETRDLASLPEDLQKAIRKALKGLDIQEPEKKDQGNVPRDPNQLALRPADATSPKKPSGELEGKEPPKGTEQQVAKRGGGQGNEGKGNSSPTGSGGAAQQPAQGSGMQQLDHARLDRKNARGQFQPDSPQIPGRGGEAGEGGVGAGSGTDPRLFGNQIELGKGSNTFQLALDATHERVLGENAPEDAEKDEGGIIEKSSKSLNQKQSLDDAIRKAQVPPEYEDIVKRLFARGESQ
jgi:hypothetical protein